MSVCRHRLYFDVETELETTDSSRNTTLFDIVPNLDTHPLSDSDDDCGLVADMDSSSGFSGTPFKSFSRTPRISNSSKLYDSGLGSPTPGPGARSKSNILMSPTKANLSPIPFPHFAYDTLCSDDEGLMTPLDLGSSPAQPQVIPMTPPHKKFRSLRLYDTPHTPKSLLERASRRVSRVSRHQQPPPTPVLSEPDKDQSRLSLGTCRPQTNINPFTEKHGTKRDRCAMDG